MTDETQEIVERARDAAEACRRAGRLSVNDYQAITSAIALLEITLHHVAALRADIDDAEARVRELEEWITNAIPFVRYSAYVPDLVEAGEKLMDDGVTDD